MSVVAPDSRIPIADQLMPEVPSLAELEVVMILVSLYESDRYDTY